MAEAISNSERIVTIEDAAELVLDQRDLDTHGDPRAQPIEGRGKITARDLVINASAAHRGPTASSWAKSARPRPSICSTQAMNTGHDGSLTTVHANSPRDALARLETMVLMAAVDLPSRAIREQLVSALQIIVQVRRFEDGVRRVESIVEMTGLEGLDTAIAGNIPLRAARRGTPRAVEGGNSCPPESCHEWSNRSANGASKYRCNFFAKVDAQIMLARISITHASIAEAGLLLLPLCLVVIVHRYYKIRTRQLVNDRLAESMRVDRLTGRDEPRPQKVRPFARRHYMLPWLAAIAITIAGQQLLHMPWTYAAALCLLMALLLGQLDAMLLGSGVDAHRESIGRRHRPDDRFKLESWRSPCRPRWTMP